MSDIVDYRKFEMHWIEIGETRIFQIMDYQL